MYLTKGINVYGLSILIKKEKIRKSSLFLWENIRLKIWYIKNIIRNI